MSRHRRLFNSFAIFRQMNPEEFQWNIRNIVFNIPLYLNRRSQKQCFLGLAFGSKLPSWSLLGHPPSIPIFGTVQRSMTVNPNSNRRSSTFKALDSIFKSVVLVHQFGYLKWEATNITDADRSTSNEFSSTSTNQWAMASAVNKKGETEGISSGASPLPHVLQ